MAISTPTTRTREKIVETTKAIGKDGKESEGNHSKNLAQVLYMLYPITFWKKSMPVLALFDSGNTINTIHLTFTQELGLPIGLMDVKAQKIDGTMLDTYGMVVTAFLVKNKANQVRFFKETLLVANVYPKVVFVIPFLTLNGADIDFLGQQLW